MQTRICYMQKAGCSMQSPISYTQIHEVNTQTRICYMQKASCSMQSSISYTQIHEVNTQTRTYYTRRVNCYTQTNKVNMQSSKLHVLHSTRVCYVWSLFNFGSSRETSTGILSPQSIHLCYIGVLSSTREGNSVHSRFLIWCMWAC